jgi:hypothetical protein
VCVLEHVSELTGAGWISPRLLSYFDTPARRLSYFCPIGRQLATNVKDSFLPSELGGAARRLGHTEGATVELVDAAKCLLIAYRLRRSDGLTD